uniref:Uncharacterized protein n=1 Tax=Cucumis melo TaxID=3656 RepID=A0A9I9EAH1_CUCME
MQALEFQISAVLVNPRNGASNFGSTFGNSTFKTEMNSRRLCGGLNPERGTSPAVIGTDRRPNLKETVATVLLVKSQSSGRRKRR